MTTKSLSALSHFSSVQSVTMLVLMLFGGAWRTDAATSLAIRYTGSDLEGFQAFELEWNATSNATYGIQVSTNLASGSWETIDLVTPTGNLGSYKIPPANQSLFLNLHLYSRLVLPQPQIFSVEPAIFPPGATVAAYVIGQCFETNDVVRVDGVPVGGIVHLNPNQFHGPLPTLSVGRHLVELVRGGVVQSSFTVTCADALANPELVLQEPPVEPPASPHAKITKSRSNIQNNRLGGWRDGDDDGDGTLDYPPDLSGQKITKSRSNIQNNRIRVDSWASVVEMTKGGGGVLPFSGEVQMSAVDLAIPGRGLDFIWARTYRSRTRSTTAQGACWDFSYNVSLTAQPDGSVVLGSGNGRADAFYPNSTGGWSRAEYFVEIGDVNQDGYPDVVTFADSGKWVFNSLLGGSAPGMLSQIVDRNGNTMRLHYNGGGQLIEVVDDLDRTNTVAYNLTGQIASVTDFSGRTVRYEHDGNGDLVAVVSPPVTGTPNGNDFPGGKTNAYTYSSGYLDDRENHLLLTAKDALGQIKHEHVYQHNQSNLDFLRCVSTQRGTNVPTMFTYVPQTPTPANQFATMRCLVNDSVGNVTGSFFDARNRCVKLEQFTSRATPGVPVTDTVNQPINKLRSSDPDSYVTRWSWKNDSLCTLETLPDGQTLQCIYESDFDSSTPARKRADCRVVREIASSPVDVDGDGVADLTERMWRYEYDPRFGSDAMVSRVMRLMDIARERSGDPFLIKDVQVGEVCDDSNTTSGDGCNSDNKVNQTAGEQCDNGVGNNGDSFVISATNPRGNVTTGEYDDHGNLIMFIKNVTGALGFASPEDETVFAYNSHGQLTAITNAADANGYRRVDRFSYYTNGPQAGYLYTWVIDSSTPDTTITSGPCEYDARGNLTRFVDRRGNDSLYTYNALDQLVRYQSPTNLTARTATEFTYDANNNLVESATELRDENDAFVRAIVPKHVFDVLGRCVATVAQVSAGQFITNKFFYDANDNVVAVHSPLAVNGADPHAITQLAYDERGLPFQTIAAPGSSIQSTTQYDYDANGNVTRVSEGLEGTPRITTLEYGGLAAGRALRYLNAPLKPDRQVAGGVKPGEIYWQPSCGSDFPQIAGTLYKNNDCDEIKSQINAQALLASKITDPLGNVTTFNYDANDNLRITRHFGQLNDTPGTNGNVRFAESRWKYDGLDRPIEKRTAFFHPATQAPIGDGASVTTFAYAPNGQCTNVTDDLGRATTFAYDTRGWLSSVTSPGGKTVAALFRDQAGNVSRTTQTDLSDLGGPPQVFTRTNVYDSWNRCISTADNVGNTNRYAYNSLSVVVHTIDAHGNWSFFEEDDLGRRTLAVADLNGDGLQDLGVDINTSWTYDANSRLVSVTDDNTNTTYYAHDSLGRQVLATSPDGTAHSFAWNTHSDLVREQDANGNVITNIYDLLGRCLRRDITPGPGIAATTTFETFAYNGFSQLVAATNDISHSEFEYDSMGNCTGNHADGWNIARSEYDSVGNRVSMTYPSGRIVTYAYDALNQVTNVSSSASAMTAPTTLATYAYEGPGRIGRIARANGINTRFTWNGLVSPPNAAGDFGSRRISRINHSTAGGSPVIDQRRFAYDRNQNKILRAQTAPFFTGGDKMTNVFHYDALNRLHETETTLGASLKQIAYALDGNGNRQLVVSNGVAMPYFMDNTPPPGPADFQMDQYSMTPFAGQAFDENGNRIAKNSTMAQLQYQYDFANRLVAVYDLITGDLAPVASYSYNALGQRVSKTVYPPSPLAPVTTEFVYGGDILEMHVGGALSDVFVHVTGLKEEIRENDSVDLCASPLVRLNAGGVATYFHADDLGNVLALTDEFGAVVERYKYADFGEVSFLNSDGFPLATNAAPSGNPFLFHGMEWDAEMGLYYQSANFMEGNFDTGFNSPLYDGDCFSRSGGRQYFNPQTASAKAARRFRDDPYAEDSPRYCDPQTGRGFNGNNPWSGGASAYRNVPRYIVKADGIVYDRAEGSGSGGNNPWGSGVSRMKFRELALSGRIPGVKKASW